MALEKVTREDWILAGIGLFLLIDLLFLPWIDISLGAIGSVSLAGTEAPDGWLGVLAALGTVAYLIDLGIERMTATELPSIGGSRARTRLILAGFVAACVALKFLFHINHIGDYGFGAFLALIAAAALVYLNLRPGTVR